MKIGVVLPQSADDGAGGTWAEIAALAAQAEAGGIDSLWVCDHFFFREDDGHEVGIHEAWTLLTAVAAVTSRVELGTLVLATSFRNPGLLAKMAATADEVAGGRIILGLGCGWYETEYDAFGYPFDHRVGRFEEALRIIVPLIRGERVSLRGKWTSVDDAVLLPPRAEDRPADPRGCQGRADAPARRPPRRPVADRLVRPARRTLDRACQVERRDPAGRPGGLPLVGVAGGGPRHPLALGGPAGRSAAPPAAGQHGSTLVLAARRLAPADERDDDPGALLEPAHPVVEQVTERVVLGLVPGHSRARG